MIKTANVIAVSLGIVVTGVGFTELSRGQAHANPALVVGGAAGYAGSRVDGAFDLVAEMPVRPVISIDLAPKGDLPAIGCAGPFRPEVQDECLDAAYEIPADEPYAVVETSTGDNSSMLTRMLGYSLAGF